MLLRITLTVTLNNYITSVREKEAGFATNETFCEKMQKTFVRIPLTFSRNFAFSAKMNEAKNGKTKRNFANNNFAKNI